MAAFLDSMSMIIRLTIKAIIRWEQIRNKSFSLMDYTDKGDIDTLLYTISVLNNDEMVYTFDTFRHILSNKKLVQEMVSKLEKEMAVAGQFQKKQGKSGMNNAEYCPETIGSIVSTLIMSGLDAHYALNEMELCDLPLYIEAYEKKRKEDMESARMWTYLTILPHIDARKMVNGAKDLIMFPWEEAEKAAAKVINETEVKRFEEFLKQGKNMFK